MQPPARSNHRCIYIDQCDFTQVLLYIVNNMDPDQTAPFWVHSDCFHDSIINLMKTIETRLGISIHECVLVSLTYRSMLPGLGYCSLSCLHDHRLYHLHKLSGLSTLGLQRWGYTGMQISSCLSLMHGFQVIKFFLAINDKCCLLYHLLIFLVAYIANIMDPDQTAPLGAVWSGFILFAPVMKVV